MDTSASASVFWFAAVAGVVLTTAVLLLVPESAVRTPARFDYLGALLLSVALASVLLAVSKAGDWGWRSGEVLGLLVLGVLSLAAWFPYQLRVDDPMIDLRTAARRPVLLTNIASICVAFALFINLLASGQQLQMPTATGYGFGLSVTQAGLAMMPAGMAMVLLSPISARLLTRLGGRITLLIGAGVMSVSYVFKVFATGSVVEIMIGTALVGVGAALSFASMPTLIMANVPITESASANGLNSLMRALGGATASAMLAAVLSTVSTTAAGKGFPALAAFEDMYWISGGVTLLAFVLASFIPLRTDTAHAAAVSGGGSETVVHGRVLQGGRGSAPRQPSIVTVTRLDGEPVDWARADKDGNYSVALPGAGRYLLIANALGWAPNAEIVDFEGATELEVELTEQLALTGGVSSNGQAVPGALVILHMGNGEFVATTTTRADGRFSFPLPPPGAYILTAVVDEGRRAQALKTVVNALATDVEIEVAA